MSHQYQAHEIRFIQHGIIPVYRFYRLSFQAGIRTCPSTLMSSVINCKTTPSINNIHEINEPSCLISVLCAHQLDILAQHLNLCSHSYGERHPHLDKMIAGSYNEDYEIQLYQVDDNEVDHLVGIEKWYPNCNRKQFDWIRPMIESCHESNGFLEKERHLISSIDKNIETE
uniref:Uncharacterized protein n=1 Tax=Cacopsylla melanoneura TaxID=428564 RepID=A0A8D8RJL6_9HEMI